MIELEYYNEYKGPELTLAQIWKHESEKEDITELIREFYGEKNNWNGMLYTYEEIFPHREGEKFYIEFERDERKHWFHGYVGAKEQSFNPPLATPSDQSSI